MSLSLMLLHALTFPERSSARTELTANPRAAEREEGTPRASNFLPTPWRGGASGGGPENPIRRWLVGLIPTSTRRLRGVGRLSLFIPKLQLEEIHEIFPWLDGPRHLIPKTWRYQD